MLDIHSLLKNLRRPKLLVQAARFGLDGFRRETDLIRLLHLDKTPRPAEALMQLLELEGEINEKRQAHASSYCLSRHIEMLTAIMAEQRQLTAISREV